MQLMKWLLDQLFSAKCPICGGAASRGICPDCLDKLPLVPKETCPHCGRGLDKCYCRHMRGECFHRLASPCYYEGGMRRGICDLKFKGIKVHAGWIGTLMAQTVQEHFLDEGEQIDLILPAPLSEKRLRERGFNQSLLLAEQTAALLELPLSSDGLVKKRDTAIQHDLNHKQRLENLHGAFQAVNEKVSGKRILLIDDVATTGTTLSECGKALYLAGAERVLCCTAALSVYHGEDSAL